MPKIKHLAIRTEDTGKLAQFYMDVFEMEMLHKDKKEGGAIFLSDGYFNLIMSRMPPTAFIISALR
jgi:catechol-2,3-dioxygenase